MTGAHQTVSSGPRGREAGRGRREPAMNIYAQMPLCGLAECIALQADSRALAELHQRTCFALEKETFVTLTGLVDCMRRRVQGRRSPCAERAYELTIDRFSHLPECSSDSKGQANPSGQEGRGGPDCRRSFRAFLQHLDEKRAQLEGLSELQREAFEARALERLVRRHFRLTLREAHRTGEWTRYVWRLPRGKLTVAMPRLIMGQDRRRWLREHVPDADSSRAGERARVQAIIDAAFQPEPSLRHTRGPCDPDDPLMPCAPPIPGEDLSRIPEEGLAEVVARDKAANIDEQRTAIRGLGPERLGEMIRKIFDGMTEERLKLARIAQEYGVSKATMTRFAGTQWATSGTDTIPDLWRNTARIVGSDPDFVEAAQRAGVWRRVEDVCHGPR